jgi:S1-C subfamily serine protease
LRAWLAVPIVIASASPSGASPSIEAALIEAAARARPAVAHVEVDQGVSWTPVLQEVLADFGIPPRSEPLPGERASGSAVIITADGRALTNHHVVAGAVEVTLVLADQRRFPARVLGGDARTDLAVLQVEADGPLPFLPLGDSSALRVGQLVLAVGSPFDFTSTTTMGIVSHVGRRGLDPREIQDYIQTDAAVNPGNSGGPLVSLRGEVIGINTAIYSQSGDQNAGISFAIPSNMARRIVDDLLGDGRVRRARIGLEVEDALEVAGDPSRRGARATWVVPRSPAAEAGLRRGDVIVEARGEAIGSADALRDLVRARPVGAELPLRVARGASVVALRVRVVDEREVGRGLVPPPPDGLAWAGATVVEGDHPAVSELGVAEGAGPVVASVVVGSPAASMGVLAGDRVVALRGRSVADLASLRAYLEIVGDAPSVVGLGRAGATIMTVLPGR